LPWLLALQANLIDLVADIKYINLSLPQSIHTLYHVFPICFLQRRYSSTISAFQVLLTVFCGMLAD